MTSLNVSLPKPMKQYLESRVKEGSYSTPSEYIRNLVREDQARRAKQRVEELVLAGAASGASIPVNDRFWQRIREQTRPAPSRRIVK